MRARCDVCVGLNMEVKFDDELDRLTAQVNHRANNLLAVIYGIVNLTEAEDVSLFKSTICGRLESLSRTNSFIAGTNWSDVELEHLVKKHLGVPHLMIKGEPLTIKSKSAQSLGMILHEMLTNAQRHGALSMPEGRIRFRWLAHEGKFIMRWEERNGPSIIGVHRPSVGWKIIENSMRQFRGTVEPNWASDGLCCDFKCDLENL